MNKNTIMIIFVLVALAVVAYVLWNNNKKWHEQATMNDSLKKMFPQLAKSVKKESDKEEEGGVTNEQPHEEEYEPKQEEQEHQEEEEEQEHEEVTQQPDESKNQDEGLEKTQQAEHTQEISEELALKIRGFAIKMAAATESISYTAEEQQFYDNNKEAIESELLSVRDELEQDKKQASGGGKGRGRHKKDCECEKCVAKRKEKEKLNS